MVVHECFMQNTFSADKKAEGHWRGRIGPLHDSVSFSTSIWIDSIAELPPLPGDASFPHPLEIPSSPYPSKGPHGVVLDRRDLNVGKSLSPPAWKEMGKTSYR